MPSLGKGLGGKVHLKMTQTLCIPSFRKISFSHWRRRGHSALSLRGGLLTVTRASLPGEGQASSCAHPSGCRVLSTASSHPSLLCCGRSEDRRVAERARALQQPLNPVWIFRSRVPGNAVMKQTPSVYQALAGLVG